MSDGPPGILPRRLGVTVHEWDHRSHSLIAFLSLGAAGAKVAELPSTGIGIRAIYYIQSQAPIGPKGNQT